MPFLQSLNTPLRNIVSNHCVALLCKSVGKRQAHIAKTDNTNSIHEGFSVAETSKKPYPIALTNGSFPCPFLAVYRLSHGRDGVQYFSGNATAAR